MTPELQSALISLAIVGLGVLVTVFKIIPDAIKLALANYDANEKAKRDQAQSDSAIKAESEHAESQITLAAAGLLETQSKTLLNMLEEFKAYREVIATNTSIARSNEKALGENTEALGDMAEHFGVLLRKGSDPLQALIKDVERIDKEGTTPLTKLQKDFDQMYEDVKGFHAQFVPPGQIISILGRMESKLDDLKEQLKVKINEAVAEKKRRTDPLPVVTPAEGG